MKLIRSIMLAEQLKISYNTLCRTCHMTAHRKKILLPSGKTKALKYKSRFAHHIDDIGKFYYLNIENVLNKDNVFMFCYVLTFANKEGYIILDETITKTKRNVVDANGKYTTSDYRYCKKKDLMFILNIGRTKLYEVVKYFLDEKMLIIEEDTGNIKVSLEYYRRGGYIIRDNINCIRVFDSSIKELYVNCPSIQYNKIDILIKLGFYTSINSNIVCKESIKTSEDKINIYKLSELSKMFGYRRLADFKRTIFDVKINNQNMVKEVKLFEKNNIMINPILHCKSNNLEELTTCENYFTTL